MSRKYEHHTTLEKFIARTTVFLRNIKHTNNLVKGAVTVALAVVVMKLISKYVKRQSH